jgi:hypothetical protein
MNAWIWGDHLGVYAETRSLYLDMILGHKNIAQTLGLIADLTLCHFATCQADSHHTTPAQLKKQLEDTMRRREKVTANSVLWDQVCDLMPLEDARKVFTKLDKILYLELYEAPRRAYGCPSVYFLYRYEKYLKESGQL